NPLCTLCPLWLSVLFRTLIKRRRDHHCSHALTSDFYFHRGSYGRQLRRHIGQRDVLLQERRRGSASHVSNFAAAGVAHFVSVASNAAFGHLEADQRALDARGFRLVQRGPANELRLLHLTEAVETGLPDINGIGNLVAVERKLAFEAQRVP